MFEILLFEKESYFLHIDFELTAVDGTSGIRFKADGDQVDKITLNNVRCKTDSGELIVYTDETRLNSGPRPFRLHLIKFKPNEVEAVQLPHSIAVSELESYFGSYIYNSEEIDSDKKEVTLPSGNIVIPEGNPKKKTN